MTRWWVSWETACEVVKSITPAHGPDGVGTAVLGLHAAGADVLSGLAKQTCVDSEQVRRSLASVDVEPVAKAWSSAVMPGTDYGRLRVESAKRDADAGAVRVVSSLVSKGVPWPFALERAAAVYGLPEREALRFAQKVAAPVVHPLVLADAADESLALFASGVCDAERKANEVSKAGEEEYVEIVVNGRRRRQRVVRDDEGQFAVQQDVGEATREVEQVKEKKRSANKRVQRRAKKREVRLRHVQSQREQQKELAAALARVQMPARKREVVADRKTGRKVEVEQAKDVKRGGRRERISPRVRRVQELKAKRRKAAQVRRRDAFMRRLQEAERRKAQVEGPKPDTDDWVKAGVQNWPIPGSPETSRKDLTEFDPFLDETDPSVLWHTYGRSGRDTVNTEKIVTTWKDHQLQDIGSSLVPNLENSHSEELSIVPTITFSDEGMKLLAHTWNFAGPDNLYINFISLIEAQEAAGGKYLFKFELVPEDMPMLTLNEEEDTFEYRLPLADLYAIPSKRLKSSFVDKVKYAWRDSHKPYGMVDPSDYVEDITSIVDPFQRVMFKNDLNHDSIVDLKSAWGVLGEDSRVSTEKRDAVRSMMGQPHVFQDALRLYNILSNEGSSPYLTKSVYELGGQGESAFRYVTDDDMYGAYVDTNGEIQAMANAEESFRFLLDLGLIEQASDLEGISVVDAEHSDPQKKVARRRMATQNEMQIYHRFGGGDRGLEKLSEMGLDPKPEEMYRVGSALEGDTDEAIFLKSIEVADISVGDRVRASSHGSKHARSVERMTHHDRKAAMQTLGVPGDKWVEDSDEYGDLGADEIPRDVQSQVARIPGTTIGPSGQILER